MFLMLCEYGVKLCARVRVFGYRMYSLWFRFLFRFRVLVSGFGFQGGLFVFAFG